MPATTRITFHRNPLSLAILCFALSPESNLKADYKPPLKSLPAAFLPVFQNREDRADFHKAVLDDLNKLASSSKFFKLAVAAINKKEYVFKLYEEGNENISLEVREIMTGENFGALTFKDRKEVYINMKRIREAAENKKEDEDHYLKGVFANEAVHIILDPTLKGEEEGVFSDKPYKYDETKAELNEMKASSNYTESEKTLHEVLNEEILSQVVDDIVVKLQKDPDYKVDKESLFEGDYRYKFAQMKNIIITSVILRMYDLSALSDEDIDLLIARVDKYVASGKVEKYLTEKLKEFGFITE